MAAEPAARRIGLIIVGDEILSGRRQDKHFSKVVELLSARGMQLGWAEFLPDDRDALTAAYRRSFASGDVVLSCGGIGGTPDDHTRQAGGALDLPLALHPEAEAIALRTAEMAAKGQGTADMSTPENQQRLQMGVFPQGCEIVPNPYNRIPGFFIRDHTFVPGFPSWPGPCSNGRWTRAIVRCSISAAMSSIPSWFSACRSLASRRRCRPSNRAGRVYGRSACPAWARLAARRISTWA